MTLPDRLKAIESRITRCEVVQSLLILICLLALILSLTGCATTGGGDAWSDVGKVLLEVGGAAADLSLFFLP